MKVGRSTWKRIASKTRVGRRFRSSKREGGREKTKKSKRNTNLFDYWIEVPCVTFRGFRRIIILGLDETPVSFRITASFIVYVNPYKIVGGTGVMQRM